jgi:hypothetical protein
MSHISIIAVRTGPSINARTANLECVRLGLRESTANSSPSLFWADCITSIGMQRKRTVFLRPTGGFLGMSVEMLDRVYGHHHPDHLRAAARAIGYRHRQSLPISLPAARRPIDRRPQPIENIGGPGRTRTCNQTVMNGGKRMAGVDFPKDLSRSTAFVVSRCGCFWCETGAVMARLVWAEPWIA